MEGFGRANTFARYYQPLARMDKKTSFAVKFSLFYLLTVAAAGTFLRAFAFIPSLGLDYQHVLHAHSHLAFLGWVYSGLFLALVYFFLPAGTFAMRRYQRIFWLTQVAAVCMFFAFLFSGYAPASVALLTIHAALVIIFIRYFVKDTKLPGSSPATWFLWVAFISFFVSTLGPMSIPLTKIYGDDDPDLLRMGIHFYLHFHYNGWFIFGIIGLLLKITEREGISLPVRQIRRAFWLMAAGLVPAYFLIVPFVPLPLAAKWIVKLATLLQWAGFAMVLYFIADKRVYPRLSRENSGKWLLSISLGFLFLKYTLELVSVVPGITRWINMENRFLTIGYLHLIFLGTVTSYIWWIFAKGGWVNWQKKAAFVGFGVFFTGFLAHELYLFSVGIGIMLPSISQMLAIFTFAMFIGILLLLSSVLLGGSSGLPNPDPCQAAAPGVSKQPAHKYPLAQ